MHDNNFVYIGFGGTANFESAVEEVGVKNGKNIVFVGVFFFRKFFSLLCQLTVFNRCPKIKNWVFSFEKL